MLYYFWEIKGICTGIKVLLVNVNYIFFLSIILIEKNALDSMERNVVFPAQKHTVFKEIIVAVLLLSHLQLLLAGSFLNWMNLNLFYHNCVWENLGWNKTVWKWRNEENTGKPCYMYNLCYGKLYCNTICCYARM